MSFEIKQYICEIKQDNVATTTFNPTQIHLLRMFSFDKSQQGLDELKDVLFKYYSQKMDEALDRAWDSGLLDQKRLDEINEMDLHALKK